MTAKTLRVAQIQTSTVDGPGTRRVVYLAGCPIECPGCQNRHLWPEDSGKEFMVKSVSGELLSHDLPITISGGEPFAQADAVAVLLQQIREWRPFTHVIVYTGFVIEDLLDMVPAIPSIRTILELADVLVDGPFIRALDHDRLQWRGSSNQRPIDLQHTYGYDDGDQLTITDIHVLDWDTPQLSIDVDGTIEGTAGVMRELFDETLPTRMCGQASRRERTDAFSRGVADAVLDRHTNPYTDDARNAEWSNAHSLAMEHI